MKTLEEVFKKNLKRLRGARTQAAIAEAADIPLRSYQHAESGIIPQGPNRTAITKALGVSTELELFMDPELRAKPSIRAQLFELIAGLNESQAEALLPAFEQALTALSENNVHLQSSEKPNQSPKKKNRV